MQGPFGKSTRQHCITCFVTESISLTYISCSCLTPKIKVKQISTIIWYYYKRERNVGLKYWNSSNKLSNNITVYKLFSSYNLIIWIQIVITAFSIVIISQGYNVNYKSLFVYSNSFPQINITFQEELVGFVINEKDIK